MTDEPATYSRSLRGILAYPAASVYGVAFILVTCAIFTIAFTSPGRGRRDPAAYLTLIAALLISSYLYRIVESTVTGDERPPKVDGDYWEDLWINLQHYMGGIFVAYMPAIGMIIYAAANEANDMSDPLFAVMLSVFVVIGTLYFPMALLLNGYTQRWSTAFNFNVGIRGIRRMGKDYLVCCMYFLAAIVICVLLWIYAFATTDRGWTWDRALTIAGTSFVGVYLFMLKMRALGILYRAYCVRLGWSIGESE